MVLDSGRELGAPGHSWAEGTWHTLENVTWLSVEEGRSAGCSSHVESWIKQNWSW